MPSVTYIDDCGCCDEAGECAICDDVLGDCCRTLRIRADQVPYFQFSLLAGCRCLGRTSIECDAYVRGSNFSDRYCGCRVQVCSRGSDIWMIDVGYQCVVGGARLFAACYLVRNGIIWSLIGTWETTIAIESFRTNFEYDLPLTTGQPDDCVAPSIHLTFSKR